MSAEPAEVFETLRPRLFGIAYRMLSDRGEAEDVVQEAWMRLGRAGGVDAPEGFLVTATTRLAIDRLRSARRRRETYVGPWLPEPLVAAEDAAPDEAVERGELLSIALLRVLDRLGPLERAVFLLREAFGYPFADVARVVGRREDHCRQVARRARERVRRERPRLDADAEPAEHRRLLQAFMAAAGDGDLAALEGLLADDVLLVSDGGGRVSAATRPVRGAGAVARFFAGIAARVGGRARRAVVTVNGLPGLLFDVEGERTVLSLDVADGRIEQVYIVRNPDKLRELPDAATAPPGR